MNITFQNLLKQVEKIILSSVTAVEKLQQICNLLNKSIPYYDWVGFYFANHANKTLHLGPFCGEPTEHICIPFGKGICGQVAESNTNFVVPDVKTQDNYIACSLTVRSEIVIPIFVKGVNIGQIDIDSHTINPFTKDDEVFLEKVNKQVASLFEEKDELLKKIMNTFIFP